MGPKASGCATGRSSSRAIRWLSSACASHGQRRGRWSGTRIGLKANFEGQVRAATDGAHLVMRMELRPQGLLGLLVPLLRLYMQRQQERNVAAIKAVLEGWGWRARRR